MSVKEEKAANKLIEKEIHEAEEELLKNPPACLLLLGPGDSGKTTLLKQMKILHGEGFSDVDRQDNLKKIRQNIIDNMQALIKASETLGLALSEPAEVSETRINKILGIQHQLFS
jgi:predicted AAA+ superfamily ATPase